VGEELGTQLAGLRNYLGVTTGQAPDRTVVAQSTLECAPVVRTLLECEGVRAGDDGAKRQCRGGGSSRSG